jgi:hypothetical protein
MGLFVLLGPFGPPAPAVPVMGYRGRPLCFHGLFPILGFAYSIDPGRRPCSLFTRSEGPAGGSCLSP